MPNSWRWIVPMKRRGWTDDGYLAQNGQEAKKSRASPRMELTRPMGWVPPCECGCGGQQGHVLSGDRQAARCSALTTDERRVIRRCTKPRGHSDLVPHGDGDCAWYS